MLFELQWNKICLRGSESGFACYQYHLALFAENKHGLKGQSMIYYLNRRYLSSWPCSNTSGQLSLQEVTEKNSCCTWEGKDFSTLLIQLQRYLLHVCKYLYNMHCRWTRSLWYFFVEQNW